VREVHLPESLSISFADCKFFVGLGSFAYLGEVVTMPNAWNRAQRYQERADECENLAATVNQEHIRLHYLKIAAAYANLAKAELKLDADARKIAAN
jgi:hypothetical protein